MIKSWMLIVVLMTAEPPQVITPLADTYDTRTECVDARRRLIDNMAPRSAAAYSIICIPLIPAPRPE